MFFIGDLIKQRRLELGMSQSELGSQIFRSKSQICKIENGDSGLDRQTLVLLSQKLNFNFAKIYMYSNMFNSYDEYKIYFELKTLITNSKLCDITNYLNLHNINDSYIDSLEPSEYYYSLVYARALSTFTTEPQNTINYCCRILNIDFSQQSKISLSKLLFDNELVVHIILYELLLQDGKIDLVTDLYSNLYKRVSDDISNNEFFIEQSQFFKKLYIVLMNNYANALFLNGHYLTSLEICSQAIEDSMKLGINYYLLPLYKLKLETLYSLQDFFNSKKSLDMIKSLSEMQNSDYYEKTLKVVIDKYSQILST